MQFQFLLKTPFPTTSTVTNASHQTLPTMNQRPKKGDFRRLSEFGDFFRRAEQLSLAKPAPSAFKSPPRPLPSHGAVMHELASLNGPVERPEELRFAVGSEHARYADWFDAKQALLRQIVEAEEPFVPFEDMFAHQGQSSQCGRDFWSAEEVNLLECNCADELMGS